MIKRLLLVAALVLAGCKHTEEPAKQTGADFVDRNIKQPIARASAAAEAVEKMAPALLDTTAMVYHKPGCKNASDTMESMTVNEAIQKGAKPDPDCFR